MGLRHLLGQGTQAAIGHFRLGDGARFVHAQHVHPGQGFGALQVLDQGIFGGQTENAGGQGQADHQVKALGDHADDCGGGGLNAFLHRQPQQRGLPVKEQTANGPSRFAARVSFAA